MRLARAALGALVCVLVLAGCSNLGGTGDKGYITGAGVPVEVAAQDRGKPLELTGEDLEGNPVDVAEMRGKPVVVNVWWSECPPCRVEQPDLNEAAAELGDQATFLGLNIRDSSAAKGLAFARNLDVTYPSIYSPDGSALLSFAGTLNPRSIPSTVVLDAEGRVAASVQGRIPTTQTLLSLVEKAAE
ncbi:TlpA disulfide reductase family protein [Nocardioides hwasunensis]|uniref:TlpA family protein disulfide reductase n=1 Tax=Nocardioides hwasunensis TaxID=397258 RepID=A0ABR8MLZ4_9ACTN|nr:TlpA disulfide reductase family protein [Nocardioides hwasunensis]MBD3915817.1 TlpA family protein disulfide reductase [Nocardioides hwasunensis]